MGFVGLCSKNVLFWWGIFLFVVWCRLMCWFWGVSCVMCGVGCVVGMCWYWVVCWCVVFFRLFC